MTPPTTRSSCSRCSDFDSSPGEQLGRKVALHPIGKDRHDVGVGPEAVGGHHGGPVIQARAGPDRETLADQGAGDLEWPRRRRCRARPAHSTPIAKCLIDRREAVGHAGYAAAERTALGAVEGRSVHRSGREGGDRAAEIGEPLAEADERSAGSHPADDRVDASARDLRDDLLGGPVSMGAGVVRVGELERSKAAALGAASAAARREGASDSRRRAAKRPPRRRTTR